MNTPSIIYNPATRIFIPRDALNSMLDWVNQLKDKKNFRKSLLKDLLLDNRLSLM